MVVRKIRTVVASSGACMLPARAQKHPRGEQPVSRHWRSVPPAPHSWREPARGREGAAQPKKDDAGKGSSVNRTDAVE